MRIFIAKIRGELVHRPARGLLVASAVLVGTTILTAAVCASQVLTRAIPESYASSLPPTCVLSLGTQTETARQQLQSFEEIEAVEPRRVLRGRIATQDGGFASLSLTVLENSTAHSVSRVSFSSSSTGVFVERSSLDVWGFQPGDIANFRLPGGMQWRVKTNGWAVDGAVAPGVQDRIVYMYATPDSVRELGNLVHFDELRVRLRDRSELSSVIERLANNGIVPDRVERVLQRHPHHDQMQAVLLLLAVFAFAALAVATALIANVVSIAVRAETRLIGLQKALGATSSRVIFTVLGWLAIVSIPAGLMGVGCGSILAWYFISFASHELNLIEASLTSPSALLLILVGSVGIGLPLLGAGLAATLATRVAPLDAILPDRKIVLTRRHSRSSSTILYAYIWRHMMERPTKLALMLFALSTGGAALVTAGTVYRSLSTSVSRVFNYRHDDLDVRLLTPIPKERLLEAVATRNATELVEAWGGLLVSFVETNGTVTSTRFGLLAPPQHTQLLTLPVAEGRWLGDPSAAEIVATRNLMARVPELTVGNKITLARGDARVIATVVGAIEEATEPGVMATQQVHDALAGSPGLAGALRIKSATGAVASEVEELLFERGIVPVFMFNTSELQRATREHFAILLILLGTVGTAALLVGSSALWSSVTVSILERRREIALMRATGATNMYIHRIFMWEGVALASMAALLSMLIALPLSRLLVEMLGQHALHIDVKMSISWTAVTIWLVALAIVISLAIVAPLFRELRNAAANSLKYE